MITCSYYNSYLLLGRESDKVVKLVPSVDETLSKVVDSVILYMIDRNLGKKL